MSRKIFISGEFYSQDEAKISVYDHGLLYGDGVFEGIRSYSGKVFKMEHHLDRLYASARAILLPIPFSQEQMAEAIRETLRVNELTDAYVRVVVTRGAGSLGLDINRTSNPQVIIIADIIQLYPRELYDSGLDIATVSTIRNHPNALNPRIKSLNYLNNILAKIEGHQSGCVEALMLNHKGEVAECTADNIFTVKGKTISTPPLDAGILEGITRNAVIEIARNSGYDVRERAMVRHDIYVADECFLTGTAVEIIPVVRLDQRPIGDGKPGPVFRELHERFHNLTRQ